MTERLPAVSARDQRRAWAMIAALGGGGFAVGTAVFVMAGVLGDLSADLGTTVGTGGLSVTVYAVGYAVASPVLGVLIGGARVRLVLVTSLLLLGLFNLVSALAPTFEVLVVARVLAALAAAAYLPVAGAAAVGMVRADQQGRALAVLLGGASTAGVIGAPLGVAIAAATSWRMAFVLVAILAVAAAVGLISMPAVQNHRRTTSIRDRLQPLRSGPVVATLGVTTIAMTGVYVVYTYIGPVSEAFGWRGGTALLIGAFGVGGLLGTFLSGMLVDRWGGNATTLTAIAVLTAAFAIFPLIAGTNAGFVSFAFTVGVAAWACVPGQQHRLMRLHENAVPSSLALNSSAASLGLATGAAVGGLAVDTIGTASLSGIAMFCGLAALVWHVMLIRRKSDHADPARKARTAKEVVSCVEPK